MEQILLIWGYTLASVILVSLVSFVGILTLSISEKNLKKILLYLVSFAAGALFGDAFIHLLPEISEESGFGIVTSLSILSGILAFFILEKIIDWHHYHMPHTKQDVHPFVITNLIGDAFHNFIDGLIIGGSYLVSIPVGIATTLAVTLHEIPQEMGDFGVLLHGGFSKQKALFFNFITALTAIIGATVALTLSTYIEHIASFIVPFAAGGFIYIAGTDLIPELHKEANIKRSIMQLLAFAAGILIMALLLLLE